MEKEEEKKDKKNESGGDFSILEAAMDLIVMIKEGISKDEDVTPMVEELTECQNSLEGIDIGDDNLFGEAIANVLEAIGDLLSVFSD